MRCLLAGVFAAALLSLPAPAQTDTSSAVILTEFVADTMPTPQCHASSVVDLDGVPAVAWFGGSYEGCADVGIWFSRREVDGWSAPVRIADGKMPGDTVFACWNPVLHVARDGSLVVFYKVGPNPREWWGMMKGSRDGGRSWSPPERLPEGFVGPVRNHPLRTAGGGLLCPSSTELTGWQVWMEHMDAGGKEWSRVGPLNDTASIGAIQPALVRMGDTILAVGRTKQGRMFRTVSRDEGESWSPMALCEFLCSNSGVDAIRLHDGRLLLVYNHARNALNSWSVGRDTITVALSADGVHWEAGCLLEVEKGAEFSYPSVMQSADGLVHVTYTWKRGKIRHIVLDPARLRGRPFRGVEWE
ncbi:MAG: exo-alpha-sialidase [Ignavibacteriae bacterium]|nr:exo-alpha-sialidase [Ignavibacteriota bacterium]